MAIREITGTHATTRNRVPRINVSVLTAFETAVYINDMANGLCGLATSSGLHELAGSLKLAAAQAAQATELLKDLSEW